MPHHYSVEELKRAKKFAETYPQYHQFLKKHPWLPGAYMIIAGVLILLIWVFLPIDPLSSIRLEKLLYQLLPFASIFALGWGLMTIIKYICDPRKIHREFEDWERKVFDAGRGDENLK